MNIDKYSPPKPEVYRRAAQFIANGDMSYTCCAILRATRLLKLSLPAAQMHLAQYKLAFGPYDKNARIQTLSYNNAAYVGGFYNDDATRHPFWSKSFSEDRQRWRVLALLLMADIVEQGA